jgi:hypothetical protein
MQDVRALLQGLQLLGQPEQRFHFRLGLEAFCPSIALWYMQRWLGRLFSLRIDNICRCSSEAPVVAAHRGVEHDLAGNFSFESYGEDPYLASRMALAFIRGVQREGVVATLKHYALNNQEIQRDTIDVQADESDVEKLRQEIARAEARLSDLVVRSPISGVVTRRVISAGVVARAGESLITISKMDPVTVVFRMSPEDAQMIRITAAGVRHQIAHLILADAPAIFPQL